LFRQSTTGIDEELERLLAEDPGLVMDDLDDLKTPKRPAHLSLPNVDAGLGYRYAAETSKSVSSSATMASRFPEDPDLGRNFFRPNVVESVQSSFVHDKK
jgi:hypothetical protein